MNKKEIKELRKEINQVLKKRKPYLASSEKRRIELEQNSKGYRIFAFILFAFWVFLFVFSQIRKINLLPTSFAIGSIIITILIHTMSKVSKLSSTIKPKNEKIDEWLWKMENKVTKTYIYSLPFVMIIPISLTHSSLIFKLSFELSAFFALLSLLLNYLISKKPILFFNQRYTETSSFIMTTAGLLFLFTIPIYFVSFFFDDTVVSENSTIKILTLFSLISLMSIYLTFSDEEKLNLSQKYALRLIKPNIILNYLKGQKKKYVEEIKGLTFLKKIEKENSLIIEKIIIERLTKKHFTKTNNIFKALLFFLIFVIGAIGESMVQDLFWTKEIKIFICNNIGLFC